MGHNYLRRLYHLNIISVGKCLLGSKSTIHKQDKSALKICVYEEIHQNPEAHKKEQKTWSILSDLENSTARNLAYRYPCPV